MKTWVKGGLIGLVVCIIGCFISFMAFTFTRDFGILFLIGLPFSIFSMIFRIMGPFGCDIKEEICNPEIFLGYFVTIILFVLIGIGVGWIVGKINVRKVNYATNHKNK